MIRLATLDDTDDIARLMAAQLEEHHIAFRHDAMKDAVRGVIEEPSRGAFLLALHRHRPVGLAYVAYIWSLEHGGRSAWLEELYVVPAMRSRGVGTRLLRETMAQASAAGCAAIDLEVDAGHARAARLYSREGFRAHRRARYFATLVPQAVKGSSDGGDVKRER
jgi:GNAT superfamily N-acetyltransferase